jgi:hypothetical protein
MPAILKKDLSEEILEILDLPVDEYLHLARDHQHATLSLSAAKRITLIVPAGLTLQGRNKVAATPQVMPLKTLPDSVVKRVLDWAPAGTRVLHSMIVLLPVLG